MHLDMVAVALYRTRTLPGQYYYYYIHQGGKKKKKERMQNALVCHEGDPCMHASCLHLLPWLLRTYVQSRLEKSLEHREKFNIWRENFLKNMT